MRWRGEKEAKESGGDGMRGNVREQWRREREREGRRGREQGLQEPGDAGLGQEGKPLPFRSL